jgi:hypothetical protein
MIKLPIFHIKMGFLFFIIIFFYQNCFVFETGTFLESQNGDVVVYNEFQYTREEILNLLYSNQKVPSGFYYENTSHSLQYVETENETNEEWCFYSTENFTEAQTVVEGYLQNDPHHPNNIKNASETEKYFEFINEEIWFSRAYNKNMTSYLSYRIHKRSYIFLYEPIYFDWGTILDLGMNKSYNIGIFNQFPINQSNTKELCEYLWFINNYNIGLNNAFKSMIIEENASIYYKLLSCEGVRGDWGMSDIIRLIYNVYSINKTSGEFSLFKITIDKFPGKFNPNPFYNSNKEIFILSTLTLTVFFLLSVFYIIMRFRRNR